VDAVGGLDEDAQSHMNHPNYHRNLHLERIDEIEVVLGNGPDRVNTERIDTVGLLRDGVA